MIDTHCSRFVLELRCLQCHWVEYFVRDYSNWATFPPVDSEMYTDVPPIEPHSYYTGPIWVVTGNLTLWYYTTQEDPVEKGLLTAMAMSLSGGRRWVSLWIIQKMERSLAINISKAYTLPVKGAIHTVSMCYCQNSIQWIWQCSIYKNSPEIVLPWKLCAVLLA